MYGANFVDWGAPGNELNYVHALSPLFGVDAHDKNSKSDFSNV